MIVVRAMESLTSGSVETGHRFVPNNMQLHYSLGRVGSEATIVREQIPYRCRTIRRCSTADHADVKGLREMSRVQMSVHGRRLVP
jgi:hypothetical protein